MQLQAIIVNTKDNKNVVGGSQMLHFLWMRNGSILGMLYVVNNN